MSRAALVLVIAVALLGCSNFDPASLVDPATLRVLALQANPAEVASNQQATIRSLVVDLNPGMDAGTITYDWALCTERPTVGVEIAPDCYDADMADYLTPLPALADGTTQFTMPNLTLADFNLPDASGGFYVPVRLRVSSGNQMVTAFINVRWAAGFEPPNHNPTLTGIDYVVTGSNGELPDMGQMVDTQPIVDGTPLDVPLGGKVRLRALDAPGSAETYVTFVGSPTSGMTQTVTEQIRFLWYTTAGKLSPDVTGEKAPDTMLDTTKYTDALAGDSDIVDIWLVALEERGGTDFLHRQVHLR
jgi:hypothetical protein